MALHPRRVVRVVLVAALAGCGAAASADTFAAVDAVDAIHAAGLPTGDARDNSAACDMVGCEALVTTDYVSAYEWADIAEAEANADVGPGREYTRVGRIVLHFGGDSDVWPFDTAPYSEAVEAAHSQDSER